MMSDSDLRQALLGTWRLVSFRQHVDGMLVKPFGDDPFGYLVYTPDGHVFVQVAARERPDLFGPSSAGRPRGPVLRETTEADTAIGFLGYCGTFEVRDGQVVHHLEFNYIRPSLNGTVEARSPTLDGDRLALAAPGNTPRGGVPATLEWERVQSGESA